MSKSAHILPQRTVSRLPSLHLIQLNVCAWIQVCVVCLSDLKMSRCHFSGLVPVGTNKPVAEALVSGHTAVHVVLERDSPPITSLLTKLSPAEVHSRLSRL